MPVIDSISQPFWTAAAGRQLALQRCRSCHLFQHPPFPSCQRCGSRDTSFERVSGNGSVYSWTRVYQAFIAQWRAALPFDCLLVELDEQQGLVMPSDSMGATAAMWAGREPAIGMAVRVCFEAISDEIILPQFVPADGSQ